MTDHLSYLVLGLGNGAVYAALGPALVMTFKSSSRQLRNWSGCAVRGLYLRAATQR